MIKTQRNIFQLCAAIFFFMCCIPTVAQAPDFEKRERIRHIAVAAMDASCAAEGNLTWKQALSMAAAIEACERHFPVDYQMLFVLGFTESEYHVYANHYNTHSDGTTSVDRGIFQTNSRTWDEFHDDAVRLLQKENVPYNDNPYDPALCATVALLHINDQFWELSCKKPVFYRDRVIAYNCGVNGALSHDPKWIDRANKYYKRFNNCQKIMEVL